MLIFENPFPPGADRYEDGIFRNANPKKALVAGWRGYQDPIAAFEHTYTTDAHATQYYIPNYDGPSYRLNKGAFRALYGTDMEPLLPVLMADVDNAGHEPWEDIEEGAEYVADVAEDAGASGWYLTRAGYRLIYILEEAIRASDARCYIRGLIRYLRASGVPADGLYDLQRLFRMPRVIRDDRQQIYPLGFIRV